VRIPWRRKTCVDAYHLHGDHFERYKRGWAIRSNAMVFKNRKDAGNQLAMRLGAYANREDVIVLGIPRGGVPVAFEIAQALNAPLDLFLSRKLGVPGQEELAFGAVAAGDGRFLDQEIIRAAGISEREIERVTKEVTETLNQRAALYRGDRGPLEVAGRTVILVDDGIATGASMYAAIKALRQMKPAKLVVAVPVAPPTTTAWLRRAIDELVCLDEPEPFYAVGQFFERFSQISDEEVMDLLRRANQPSANRPFIESSSTVDSAGEGSEQEVAIEIETLTLEGTLSIPQGANSIVLFAHGSGSSRHSPRNRYVAGVLQSHGIATLLFDLLTHEEEVVDESNHQLRFNIALLAKRLVEVTQWITQYPSTKALPIGYFGASTGAAAALLAATSLPDRVAAIVSRGGRPDLALEALGQVGASVLLIVGGADPIVITLNRQALRRLQCRNKQLVVVPGATHLFEEPGKLEEVAQTAADWFAHFLVPNWWNKGTRTVRASRAR
jgi:putative phosphoribosyl transferase